MAIGMISSISIWMLSPGPLARPAYSLEMRIEVVCFGMLRDHLPPGSQGNRARMELAPDASVDQVGQVLGIPERQVFALLVNGERANLDQILQEGDEVTLMPPFSGGRRPQG